MVGVIVGTIVLKGIVGEEEGEASVADLANVGVTVTEAVAVGSGDGGVVSVGSTVGVSVGGIAVGEGVGVDVKRSSS